MKNQTYINALRAQLVSLKARREAAANYILNTEMRIEMTLLDAQIDAIEAEIKKGFGNSQQEA
ncbi:hypothetical protein [Burkholderia phage BCSR52]|uniref:Uncharacterized protein n=1 Tax=Burkholderia phage BCSR52 TaxID=2805748 RepID=A0A889IR79_9CAUD|nr:hypothetical protein [Burkholderia phage BCSR52]